MTRRVARNIFSASYRFPPDIELSAECLNFVSRVLVSSARERMTAEEMLQHAWLSGKLLPTQHNVEENYQSILDIQAVMGEAPSFVLFVMRVFPKYPVKSLHRGHGFAGVIIIAS